MTPNRVPVLEILKWHPEAACWFCGKEAHTRPDYEDWTLLDGKTYCPECTSRENIY